MNCDKSHELCFAHELFASEHELANAMKNGADANADVVILENLFSLELPIHATVGSRSADGGIRNVFVLVKF